LRSGDLIELVPDRTDRQNPTDQKRRNHDNKNPVRETEQVGQLFTHAHGRISAIARGARSSRRRFGGALQLLVLARYRLARPRRGELWSLDAADVEREWTKIAGDVVAHAHAAYVVELAAALAPPEQPEPDALAAIVATWDGLADAGPSPAALRAVELSLLELAGHRPALDACAACGRSIASGDLRPTSSAAEGQRGPIDGDGTVFDPTRGGVVCRTCAAASRGPGVRAIDSGAIAYLRAVAAAPTIADARSLDADARFTAADRHAGRDALVAMATALVGKPLRSLEYIAKLGGKKP
jgi:DNA repair protein RecO (recombination protein O)